MKELLEYCKSTVKCDWLLTKDFLLVQHYLLTDNIVKLVAPHVKYLLVLPYNEGILFAFNSIGLCSNKAKIIRFVKCQCETDTDYILGQAMGRDTIKTQNIEIVMGIDAKLKAEHFLATNQNGKVIKA